MADTDKATDLIGVADKTSKDTTTSGLEEPAAGLTNTAMTTRKYTMRLTEESLWSEFHLNHNEMIITKAGRSLFPLLRICPQAPKQDDAGESMLEVDPRLIYKVVVQVNPVDDMRWKWRGGKWQPMLTSRSLQFAGEDHHRNWCTYHHRISGIDIIRKGLQLERIKLTNRPVDGGQGHQCCIFLQSFRRYIPVIKVISSTQEQFLCFPQTEFIAVTHYQNERITVLKKSYNPHAKGFIVIEEIPGTSTGSWSVSQESTFTTSLPARDASSTGASSELAGKRRKIHKERKRIKPFNSSETATIPSDEEELQGGLALQSLGS